MKQLKIVEQIIIVLIFAVLIPFITIGIIIANISQQSVRNELANNASIMAQVVGESTQKYIEYTQYQLNQIASGYNYVSGGEKEYFKDVELKTKIFKDIKIIPKSKYNKTIQAENEYITLVSEINKDKKHYLSAKIKVNIIDDILSKDNVNGRNIFIVDYKTKKLIGTNNKNANFENVLKGFNFETKTNKGFFGDKKNTPKAYYIINNPNWLIIVDTTKKVTANTINKARYKIILSLCFAALSIFIIVSIYTSYLYINIRQLFKGITAISKGNYDKKIHLIKSPFTPHETIFLAKEFNYMAKKVNVSYKDLREKNKKLEKLNEFRENLISATSHEFRTPLTSIIGYTSRLLRHDIVVDEQTRVKSLKIIKQQAQRLADMVEDLLVIPELDSYSLKFNIQEVDLMELINQAIEFLSKEDCKIILNTPNELPWVWADEARLEQIFINLIDNAIKYNINNEPIKIEAKTEDNIPVVKISNKCEEISQEIKAKLFDKFIRADSKLTRTTRGTGLGLYIVKGLAQGMNIEINLECENEFIITLRFIDYVK